MPRAGAAIARYIDARGDKIDWQLLFGPSSTRVSRFDLGGQYRCSLTRPNARRCSTSYVQSVSLQLRALIPEHRFRIGARELIVRAGVWYRSRLACSTPCASGAPQCTLSCVSTSQLSTALKPEDGPAQARVILIVRLMCAPHSPFESRSMSHFEHCARH